VWAIGAAGVIASALRFRLRGSVSQAAGEATQSASFLSNLPLWWSLVWWFAGIHGVIDLHAQRHFQSLHLPPARCRYCCSGRPAGLARAAATPGFTVDALG
jgi:hypothetical protein